MGIPLSQLFATRLPIVHEPRNQLPVSEVCPARSPATLRWVRHGRALLAAPQVARASAFSRTVILDMKSILLSNRRLPSSNSRRK